jgi:hypothetical protein
MAPPLMVCISRVWPSGSACATTWLPMLPPAPGRFSTTTCWPRRRPSGSLSSRAAMSVVPAGVKPPRSGQGASGPRLGRGRAGEDQRGGEGGAEQGAAGCRHGRLLRAVRELVVPLLRLPAVPSANRPRLASRWVFRESWRGLRGPAAGPGPGAQGAAVGEGPAGCTSQDLLAGARAACAGPVGCDRARLRGPCPGRPLLPGAGAVRPRGGPAVALRPADVTAALDRGFRAARAVGRGRAVGIGANCRCRAAVRTAWRTATACW